MNKLLLLSLCALVVILINLWVRYNIVNAELFIDADRISYKTEYLFTVIDLRDVPQKIHPGREARINWKLFY